MQNLIVVIIGIFLRDVRLLLWLTWLRALGPYAITALRVWSCPQLHLPLCSQQLHSFKDYLRYGTKYNNYDKPNGRIQSESYPMSLKLAGDGTWSRMAMTNARFRPRCRPTHELAWQSPIWWDIVLVWHSHRGTYACHLHLRLFRVSFTRLASLPGSSFLGVLVF